MAVPSLVTIDTVYGTSEGLEAVIDKLTVLSISFTAYSIVPNEMTSAAKDQTKVGRHMTVYNYTSNLPISMHYSGGTMSFNIVVLFCTN